MNPPWRIRAARTAVALLITCLPVLGCTSSGGEGRPNDDDILDRLDAIDLAVADWRSATALASAHAAAEAARNLVVGPGEPGYGDADGNGSTGGASAIGLLPGLDGRPGLATPADGSCVEADVLGGSWADPASRWATLEAAIDAWAPSNNTFPALPSHPQRVVGWATLALESDDLSTAIAYGGHAALHAAISRQAVTGCAYLNDARLIRSP